MTQVEKIIRKHYLNKKPVQWEKCGNAVYDLIRQKGDIIRAKQLSYQREIRELEILHDKLENEYISFFVFYSPITGGSGFDWINGNNKLKTLLNTQNNDNK